MASEFRFPDVGEGIHEGILVKWRVREGETVKADQILAEVETDKAVVELPSPFTGTVLKLNFKEGDEIKVGQILVVIGGQGEQVQKTNNATDIHVQPGHIQSPKQYGDHVIATPSVRKLARELGVNLT